MVAQPSIFCLGVVYGLLGLDATSSVWTHQPPLSSATLSTLAILIDPDAVFVTTSARDAVKSATGMAKRRAEDRHDGFSKAPCSRMPAPQPVNMTLANSGNGDLPSSCLVRH